MSVQITAAMVNELRARTGQGMMECKKMLQETAGDIQKAIDEFRKRGVKSSITERVSGEGRVHAGVSGDRKTAAAVAILCNTDFTARSEPMTQLLAKAVAKLLDNPSASLEQDAEIQGDITSMAQTTGENVKLGKVVTLQNPEGVTGAYVYPITSKIGVLMALRGKADEELIRSLGGHISFARPLGLTRDAIPADLVARERELAVEAAKATGKPQQIAEKIAEGKLNSFFAERVLLDQEFFNPQAFKGTVGAMLKQAGVELLRYERVEIGK
ncbi:MAG: translation elongation factor Ts [Phycisphaerae bacterium]|nr:translation elongation factor Ts [Phycisphaerae bacterium]MDW8263045.1 translation elongation factor Ts [Phycisphaerales bacterium]